MITLDAFKNLVRAELGRDLDANPSQNDAIGHDSEDILMLVAGPGSGKTTVLVVRALRHMFVDDVLPDEIVITTFTRKAARELRTRWLDWGTSLLNTLRLNPALEDPLNRIDLNRCRIDTLDSLAEQALTENRLPGEIAPIIVEKAAAKLMLKRWSFNPVYQLNKNSLDQLFLRYSFPGQTYLNHGEALATAQTLCDRLIQDRVDLVGFAGTGPGESAMVEILRNHVTQLQQRGILDFAALEQRFLDRLQSGDLNEWVNNIRVLMIDEYQDTNPLQEAIYFELIGSASPSVTVVGDDDQSMYRFRGGSVELFTEFGPRCRAATGRGSHRVDMVINYRSSEEIVSFYNNHILGDPSFTAARIVPRKPEVISYRGALQMPVLGLFAPDPAVLAERLAFWLDDLMTNRASVIRGLPGDCQLTLNTEGDLGDLVIP